MKLSVAIADSNALPSAFVVFRGFEASIRKAARMGYDGVELALKHAAEVDAGQLTTWLSEAGMEVSCISTGQVYADLGLSFTDVDPVRRANVRRIFTELIDLAAEFGRMVNIGRIRGQVGAKSRDEAERLFVEMTWELCTYAATRRVTLLLEPANRYELDFVNNLQEGAALLEKVGLENLKLMPDLFHMNIEDVTIAGELARYKDHVAYVHFADSNRRAPGQGHIDFQEVLDTLKRMGYDGWIAVEILPHPDPDTAARQAIEHLGPLIEEYRAS
jgi:sugar phosphate isomerase/epimerase